MLNPGPLLARGQDAAEDLMTDACTITRTTSEVTNPDTGRVTRTTVQVYAGKCRWQHLQRIAAPSPQLVGGASVLVSEPQLQLPVSVTTVLPNDLVKCDAAGDPALVGRTWRARPTPRKTNATKTVIGLVEVTG